MYNVLTMTELKRVNFKLPDIELEKLERYCQRVKRSKTDVLRELIRALPEDQEESQAS